MVDKWTTDDVCNWLQTINLIDSKEVFREQEIDGETLLGLTERMVQKLFPTMKQQVIFLKELERLKRSSSMEQKCCEPWPAVFSLPDFPPELNESLQRKDPSFKKKEKSHLRSLLIQVLFDSITKYTWYPSHKIYTDVLGSLIKRFPFLKDTSPSGHDTLLHCLRNKFKKERIPLVHSSAVQEMKKKFGVKRNALETQSLMALSLKRRYTPVIS
ncbi:sterile alpha motif domain-containing protein 3-like [Cyprinus carpio]|uniref:Sterile alpha motif domain-containing protein 3-like n=1 Tax=Cyprinus carpio TaxID=7962 RepID=A0A9R0B0R1_CYPCA|nr:sterile alpha motif domain-containing protein 3-like [Cyprinus carpio]